MLLVTTPVATVLLLLLLLLYATTDTAFRTNAADLHMNSMPTNTACSNESTFYVCWRKLLKNYQAQHL
jgi:hypothetical protein